jgi:hypothetical protein
MYPCCNCDDSQADHRGQQHQTSQLLADRNPHLDHVFTDRCPSDDVGMSGGSGIVREVAAQLGCQPAAGKRYRRAEGQAMSRGSLR